MPRLQILILAAGFSSRLGRPKALARVRSVSLLRRTLLLATQLSPARIMVVIPHRAARYRVEAHGLNVLFVANPLRADGLSSSVRLGIARGRYSPALLLLPVDLAAARRCELARLISRWRGTPRRVVARRIGRHDRTSQTPHDGAPQGGVPLILPRRLYPRALAVTGDIGLRELVNGLPAEERVLVDLPSAELDVDTPQDLHAARRGRRGFATSP
ncbi:MAG TPA: NTP transferase domain-containing protein [Steroidobacteraceae bacterium]